MQNSGNSLEKMDQNLGSIIQGGKRDSISVLHKKFSKKNKLNVPTINELVEAKKKSKKKKQRKKRKKRLEKMVP